jgi:uncharacterized protein
MMPWIKTWGDMMSKFDEKTTTELEAAAFRTLMSHLRNRPDIQNIDMMNLTGFCRNCLGNWLMDAAKAQGLDLSKDESREHVYGMPYDLWREQHQKEASAAQQATFAQSTKSHG